jgi:hypothetical protein
MQAHFNVLGKASDTVDLNSEKGQGILSTHRALMPEGRLQIHPGFAQSVPSAFSNTSTLKDTRAGFYPATF